MDAENMETLRAQAEIEVHRSGKPWVRLHGGPMDRWAVFRDADVLAPEWYMTWPATVAAEQEAGRYELSENGKWANWKVLARGDSG